MMKKLVSSLVILGFVATPAFAGGDYRIEPEVSYVRSHDTDCKACKVGSGLWDATKFVLKLPFRVVTSTGKGVYDLIVDQDFTGFEEGYELI